MKRFFCLISALLAFLSLFSCTTELTEDVSENYSYNDVDEIAMTEFLKNNISAKNTADEIIDVFEEMCEIPIEDGLLLNEYGVYDFTGEDLFYYDLVRQYPDGDGEFYQLRVSLIYEPDKENRHLQNILWSDDTDENFFDYIRKSKGYSYVKNHKLKSVDIRIDQT